MMDLSFLVGKTITKAFYNSTTSKQSVTLHFDDDTLYGWAPDLEERVLIDCGPQVIPFAEIEEMERKCGMRNDKNT